MAPLDKKVLITIAGTIIAIYFGRLAWGELAYHFFRHKCDTQAGEFIYKTVENVEGIYQMRLRDPKDYFDRLRKGDIPEDPFGHTNVEAQDPWIPYIGRGDPKSSYKYFETTKSPDASHQRLDSLRFENELKFTGEKYWVYRRRFESSVDAEHNNRTAHQASNIKSEYGFTWREVRTRLDRIFGIWGGEIIVVNLQTNKQLAIRRGFILWATFSDRTGICPRYKSDFTTSLFVKSILKPSGFQSPIVGR